MEDKEYKKLPAEEKCVHKLWKARVCGFEEVTQLFRQIDDKKSPEFEKYLGLVKKFVTDSNAMGQEKGLEATLAYVENYAHAGKTVSEVMSGIVTKCVAAPGTKTRELALQITLMYIEIGKYEAVQEELMKGTEQKNRKIVSACIQALTTALHEFGVEIINPNPIIKKISDWFSYRDKGLRDEARLLVIEMYKWMGPSLKNHLQAANLESVQMTELEAEFAKVEGQKAVPTRYIRSQQQKQAKLAASAEETNEGEDEGDEDEAPQEIDPADPVDILSKLPEYFYESLEAQTRRERKKPLEFLETLLKHSKLENGDYGDMVRALTKVVDKDHSVVCVALAGRCIAGLASSLKERFQTYSGALISPLLKKFKEKNENVVTALREAIDATYLTTSLEAILDDVLESLNNEHPSVKSETSLFLARAFVKTQPTSVNKKLLQAITAPLTKNMQDSYHLVKESTAQALGTLMKLVGEKAIGPFLVELEKDNLKMSQIKEFCEKAEITVKVVGVKKPRPQTAPSNVAAHNQDSGDTVPAPPVKTVKKLAPEFGEIETNYTEIQEEAKELCETKEKQTAQFEELAKKNKALEDSNQKLGSELAILEKKYRDLEEKFMISERRNKKLIEESDINSEKISSLSNSLNTLTQLREKLLKDHNQLTEKAKHNQAEIRKLRNEIQDLKGNIRVFCRVRPPIKAEEQNRLQCCITFIGDNGMEISKSRERVSPITGKAQDLKSEFMFDKVFPTESTQEEIFEDLAQLVQSALDGYDVCVFAYGQTGSGKTYTMQGGESPESKGMVPRTFDLIFENIAALERSGWKYTVQVSFLEIYNENVRDLLNINSSQRLEIHFNDGKGTTVKNLTIQPIESADELKKYMRLAHRSLATAATDYNEHSSRSHAVTKLYLKGVMNDRNLTHKGSINLVDLAGSESAKSISGERLTETKNINKSLTTLGDVISALHCKSKHIPYRNSKLTYLLQSCLGGNSKTLMVVNISPFEECFRESLCSLRFAAKVKEVKTASKRNKVTLALPIVKHRRSASR